jgi:hypothetical protein
MVSERASFFGVSALLFAASAAGDDRLVRIHVGNGRDADARRLNNVDGVDADARTDATRRAAVSFLGMWAALDEDEHHIYAIAL